MTVMEVSFHCICVRFLLKASLSTFAFSHFSRCAESDSSHQYGTNAAHSEFTKKLRTISGSPVVSLMSSGISNVS